MTADNVVQGVSTRKPVWPWIVLGLLVVAVLAAGAACFVAFCLYRVQAVGAKAREALARVEIEQLNMALNEYRNRMGAFPSRADPKAITQHVYRAFPRWQNHEASFRAAGLDLAKLDDAEALVFWLGGMHDRPGSTKLIGFSRNPANPLDAHDSRTEPYFQFASDRLVDSDGDGWLEYVVESPPDWKRRPYQYDGKKAFLPGLEPPGAAAP
jgi:hypothetical protein